MAKIVFLAKNNKIFKFVSTLLLTVSCLLSSSLLASEDRIVAFSMEVLSDENGEYASQPTTESLNVTFVCPCGTLNHYWRTYIGFLQAAALDLGIHLRVVYSGEYRRLHLKTILKEIAQSPDYLISMFVRREGHRILQAATEAEVPIMLVNVDISDEDRQKTGQPREVYPYWIGQLAPDDYQAGYDLGEALITKAKRRALYTRDNKIHLVAIAGNTDASFAKYRLEGLYEAVKRHPEVELRQVLTIEWQDPLLEEKVLKLIDRFPEVGAIWNVTNEIAQGVIRAVESDKKLSGEDILVGGVDWTLESIRSLKAGKQNFSVGGHFMEGARALAMIYDYHHGRDFGNGKPYFSKRLEIISNDNVDKYEDILYHNNWHRIDFRQLTKTHNNTLEEYDFGIDNLLKHFADEK